MQPLLLLHGAIGSKEQLQPLADALKDRYSIHLINFSGHGGETFNGDFSIPLFANEVLNYIQQHQVRNVHIFGYSMGGYVALYLAKHHPHLVERIVTLATKFHWDEEIAAKETKMLDSDTIAQKVPAFAEQLRLRHLPNDWKEVLSKTKQMLVQLGQQNALQLADYKDIKTPTILLLGEKDKMVTLEETLAVQQALPNAVFKALANTSHPIEQVDVELLAVTWLRSP